MSGIPNPPEPREQRGFPWLGCSLGCGAIAVLAAVGFVLAILAALELPPFSHDSSQPTVPTDFVGEWRTSGTVEGTIAILPDGRASCNIKSASSSFELNGARARFDPKTNQLSIKFWIIGPQWHVDQRPTQNGSQTEMILNGQLYLRLTPAQPPGPKSSAARPWEV
jgi:hypothetical protein